MLRKTIIGVLASILGGTLLLFFVSTLITTAVRPSGIKSWVASSGLYTSVVDNVLKQAETKAAEQGDKLDIGGLSLKDPAVQRAANEALTPSFLQASSEKIVDGSFEWLDGKSEKPNFAIDLAPIKQRFADSLAAYAKQRYVTLPDCAPRTLPTSTDALTINCKPAVSFDLNAQIEQFRNQILQSEDFLPRTVLSPDTLQSNDQPGQQPFSQRYKEVPQAYQKARMLPGILAGMALVFATAIIFFSEPKKHGLRRVGWSVLIAGVTASILTVLLSAGFAKGRDKITSDPTFASSFKDSAVKLLDAAQHDFMRHALVICVLYIVVGTGIVVGLWVYHRRLKPTPPPGAGRIIAS